MTQQLSWPGFGVACECRSFARAGPPFAQVRQGGAVLTGCHACAGRGRGKSAALGLAIAGALALGYSNIFVSAPSPENLRTLFEFIFKV